ncbi:MAG: hypothetical protein ACOYMF_00155 [Bacteroidales bacterium]
MRRNLVSFVLIILMSSCGTSLKINKTIFQKIDNSFSGTYCNKLFKTSVNGEGSKSEFDILELLDINDVKTDSVNLEFTENGSLMITYKDSLLVKVKTFRGKFKRGYYQIYHRRERIIIPIIFSHVDVRRIRLCKSEDKVLVIDYYEYVGGNFLVFAGGGPWRRQYFFRK